MADLTPLGALLERARQAHGLSKREAARRAEISEGRWRQVVSGQQRSGDVTIPVNPRRITVINMARAVGVDEDEALRAAGFEPVPRDLGRLLPPATRPPVTNSVEALIREIFDDPAIPEDRKHELVRMIRRAEAERQAVQDELDRWRRAG